MSQRRISKHNSYCEILLMNQADSVQATPPTRQTTFKNNLHTHRDSPSLGRKKPPPSHPRHLALPSDASGAFNRSHGARCSNTGQDAPQACSPFAAIRRSTSPSQKWWSLQWQGKLSPDSPSMEISPDGRKYTVHFWPLSGPNVNITVKSSNSDTRHGAIYSSRIKLATEFIPKYRVYFPGACP